MFKKKKSEKDTKIVNNPKQIESKSLKINLTPLEEEQLRVQKQLNESYFQKLQEIGQKELELFNMKIHVNDLFNQAMTYKQQLDTMFKEKYGDFVQKEDGSLERVVEEKQ